MEKPRLGSPCNGCGMCCIVESCPLSVEHFGKLDACPALEKHGDRYACGLVTNASAYLGSPEFGDAYIGRLVGDALGIGRGCDSDDPPSAALTPHQG